MERIGRVLGGVATALIGTVVGVIFTAPLNPPPYVTVTVESTREGFEALLAKEGLIEQSYTPLGIAWSNLMQAIRNALGRELMGSAPKYSVYQDKEQWLQFFSWFWIRPGETGMGHGAYPAKWIASLSAWWHNR